MVTLSKNERTGGDLVSTGVKKLQTRAEQVEGARKSNFGKPTKANDNVELALAA